MTPPPLSSIGVFSIESASDFLRKVQADLVVFQERIADPGRALNCVLGAYHLHDWFWAAWLKAQAPASVRGQTIRTKKGLVAWLEQHCPHFAILQDLANGSKHCRPVVYGATAVSGYGQGPYGIGPYGVPYLLIDRGDHVPAGDRWLSAHTMLNEIVDFWVGLFAELGVN